MAGGGGGGIWRTRVVYSPTTTPFPPSPKSLNPTMRVRVARIFSRRYYMFLSTAADFAFRPAGCGKYMCAVQPFSDTTFLERRDRNQKFFLHVYILFISFIVAQTSTTYSVLCQIRWEG